MGNEWQPKKHGVPEDGSPLGDDLLRDLGWMPPPTAAGVVKTAPPEYCSFCWCKLAPGASECGDCGHSVAEMDAARTARELQDQRWIPPRLRSHDQKPSRTVAAAPAGRAGRQARSPADVRYRWRDLLIAVGVGSCGGAAFVSAAWLLILGLHPTAPAPALVRPSPPGANEAPGAHGSARVEWENRGELRMRLVGLDGKTVARSWTGTVNVAPGSYRLRVSDEDGRWRAPEEALRIGAGTSVLSPKPAVVAEYYVWKGKRLHRDGRPDEAEAAWAKAIENDAGQVEARLQLAASLAVRFRYDEARAHLREAQRLAPGDENARRLARALEGLEK